MDDLKLLRYPIRRCQKPNKIRDKDLMEYIGVLGDLPTELARTVESFDDVKLEPNIGTMVGQFGT